MEFPRKVRGTKVLYRDLSFLRMTGLGYKKSVIRPQGIRQHLDYTEGNFEESKVRVRLRV